VFSSAKPVRLLGVGVTQLYFDGLEQLSLFPDKFDQKQRRAEETIDSIRKRFGIDTIVRAGTIKNKEPEDE
jgi:DNA polymerase-4